MVAEGRWGGAGGGVRKFMNHTETQFRGGEYSSMHGPKKKKGNRMKDDDAEEILYCRGQNLFFITLFCVIQTLDSGKYPRLQGLHIVQ